MVGHRGKFAYKHSGIEGSVFGNKVFPDPSFESKGLGGLGQCNSGGLPQQTGGDSLTGDVSHDLASDGFLQPQGNFAKGSSYPRVSECDSRQSVSQGQDYLAQTNGRYVCNQDEQQTTSLCISSPRSKCNVGRCIEYLVAGSRRLCLMPSCSHTQTGSKDENLCLPNDCSSPRVARDELVLGSNRTVHKNPTTTSSLGNSPQTTVQLQVPSKSPVSESTCLASGFKAKSPQKFSKSVAERVKAPQRFSSRRVYESRWTIFESWCKQSQVEFEKPTLSSIADFLTYLFNEKALKSTTIAGYRTAIADHLGPAGIEISHSFELNRLIASFHRDRPMKDRNIPSWDLSLVLLALTKAPFEPLKDAPLKILTFKTVFFMTLASGRRRGEVHSWSFRSLKHKSCWKEFTVSPSSVFLAKNQLASDGPSIIPPVVIPALKTIVGSNLS